MSIASKFLKSEKMTVQLDRALPELDEKTGWHLASCRRLGAGISKEDYDYIFGLMIIDGSNRSDLKSIREALGERLGQPIVSPDHMADGLDSGSRTLPKTVELSPERPASLTTLARMTGCGPSIKSILESPDFLEELSEKGVKGVSINNGDMNYRYSQGKIIQTIEAVGVGEPAANKPQLQAQAKLPAPAQQ